MKRRRGLVFALLVCLLGALVWWATRTRATSAEVSSPPTPTSQGPVVERARPGDEPTLDRATAEPTTTQAAVLGASPVDAGRESANGSGSVGALTDEQIRAALERNGERAAREVERFCDESRKLKKAPLFPESPRRNDAAVFFASRVDWEGTPPRYGSLRPAEPLRQKINAAGPDWPTALTDADLVGLDFSWLQQALAYDVWTLRGDGAADEAHVTAMWASIPNYIPLLHWVKLRFRKAARDGDWADAVVEVRHLAALVNSQDLAVASVTAANMLRLELRARAFAEQLGVDLSSLPPAPDGSLLELQRPLVTRSGWFTAPGVPREVRRRALGCTATPCVTAIEGLTLHSSLRPWAPDGLDGYLDDVSSLGCDTLLFSRLARRPAATPEEVRELLDAVRGDEPLLPAAR